MHKTHLNHDSNNTSPNIKIPPICGISQWKNRSVLILTFNNTLPESWINKYYALTPHTPQKKRKDNKTIDTCPCNHHFHKIDATSMQIIFSREHNFAAKKTQDTSNCI